MRRPPGICDRGLSDKAVARDLSQLCFGKKLDVAATLRVAYKLGPSRRFAAAKGDSAVGGETSESTA